MSVIFIADSTTGFREGLEYTLEVESNVVCTSFSSLSDASAAAFAESPHVLVLGPGLDEGAALDVARALSAEQPETATVMVAPTVDADLLRRAIRAGVKDVRSASEPMAEIAAGVIEATTAAGRWRDRVVSSDSARPCSDQGALGKVVTVFSTKGGVGKTVIASNIAVALAADHDRKVILLDLDLEFGDVGIVLKLTPERTIHDAVQVFDRLDAEMLSGYLLSHKSGLKVLLAPTQPEDADVVTTARVSSIIRLLRQLADYVIIDTPASFGEIVLAAIDESDEVYAIATMDVASIKNMRISLQKLGQMGYDRGRIQLVLNRADSKVWLEAGEVEDAIDSKIVAKIPSDRLVPRSVNKGVPVVLDAPRSPVAKSLAGLARTIVGHNGEVARDVT